MSATFFTAQSVIWYPGSPTGLLPGQVIDATAQGAFGLDVADMDRDGDLDIVIGSGALNRVRTYENLGGGTFGPPGHVHGFKEDVWGVRFGNLDDDFDPEIVSGASTNRTVVVNENQSAIGGLVCYSDPNSTGERSKFSATGSRNADWNEVLLVASRLPENQLTIFMASMTRDRLSATPGSRGTLCLGGAVGRFLGPGEVQSSGPDGRATLRIDTQRIPQPSGAIPVTAGSTWFFQAWHRDAENGQPVSHYTQARRATFQ
ncbi:MAG: VCBS repeat-containing protein [Planctomycetota bacterium]